MVQLRCIGLSWPEKLLFQSPRHEYPGQRQHLGFTTDTINRDGEKLKPWHVLLQLRHARMAETPPQWYFLEQLEQPCFYDSFNYWETKVSFFKGAHESTFITH